MATVTFKGNPLNLVGNLIKVGDKAPDFVALDRTLNPVSRADLAGRVCVLTSVPSLDTPVCDLQAKRFNQEATSLGDKVQIVVISVDLPFAQARWCGATGSSAITTLSDHKETSFGKAYGLLIEELRLLARAVVVLDAEGTVVYVQLVPEVTSEPDYDDALRALKALL